MSCTVEGHSQRSLPVRSRTIGLSERASGNTEKRHLGGEGQNFAHVFPKTWQVNWGKYSYVDDIDMRSDQSFLSSYFCVQASLWSSHVWTRKPLKNSWSWKIWICPRQVMSKLYAFLPQFKWIISGIVYNMSQTTQYTCAPFPSSTATSQNRATLTPYSQLGLCETNPLSSDKMTPGIMGRWFSICVGTSNRTSF